MSLKITSSEIQIQNAQGSVKFSSADKLVFPRASQIGTITISNSTVYETFTNLNSNEFLHLTIKFNSCTGNAGAGLIGLEVPANGSILVDFNGRAVGSLAAADSEYLSAALVGNQLVFTTRRVDYNNEVVDSITTTSLTYHARIFSYL